MLLFLELKKLGKKYDEGEGVNGNGNKNEAKAKWLKTIGVVNKMMRQK